MSLFSIPSIRRSFLFIFAFCTGLMVFAMFLQHALQLAPCPLCITQRVIVVTIGILAFIAWLQNPPVIGVKIYGTLLALFSILGAAVAGRHVWLQNLPEDKAPACGPDLSFMLDAMPLSDVFMVLFTGDGNCAEVVWRFLGLSIPMWTLIAFVLLLGASLWQLLRKNSVTSS